MSNIRFSPRPNRAHEINWQEWGEAAFEQAQEQDKPILLSISAVWCHWCHVMDETSYSDPEVIRLINQRFMPIRVDNDQRPDINSRYNMGGWPTTAFLTPYGDVIAGATYLPPQQLGPALEQVSDTYKQQRETLLRRGEELRAKRQEKADLASSPQASDQDIDESIVDNVLQIVVDAYDEEYGGFGSQPKFPMSSAVELLLHTYQYTGNNKYRLMAEKTLDSMMTGGMYDHQEEGFFRYSTTRDWSIPHFEKMLEDNVGLLRLYLMGHLVTGREEYAGVASRIVEYLDSYLYDPASGAFYGSQDADEEYYALSLEQRREQAAPGIDRVFYTHMNAALASAYLWASWALNRPDLRDTGMKTLEYLLEKSAEGHLRHSYSVDGEAGIPALLIDYANLVTALVDAYDLTSSPRYLDKAQSFAGEMMDIFGDSPLGDSKCAGFFDVPADPHAQGILSVRDKPMSDNVPAIEAMIKIFNLTFKDGYREAAGKALRTFVSAYQDYNEAAAGYALAVHRLLNQPVEVSVVGEAGSPSAKAILTAAATIPYPHTAIKFIDSSDEDRLAATGYWAGQEAQAYVCLETVCLPPVSDPHALHSTVTEFLESRTQGMGGGIFQNILDLGQR
jgi:uncharacterized protein YyaL (SSP411 family)